jgi:hydrogenase 3 maturation protease
MDYLIMCIGNVEGGDDAVGPYIAERLNHDFTIIDCGTIPENYTSLVKKHDPDNLLIIDAVDMGLSPGEIRIVPKEKIGVMHISTHGIPISVIIGYLENYVKNIIIIGIQPKQMTGELSDTVKKKADELIKILRKKQLKKIKIFS